MENLSYGLALLHVREAWEMKIWKEEVIRPEKESIFISTEALAYMNKSELTGESEEPGT